MCHSRQAGGGVGGVLLLGSSLADVWRSLPHNSNKARAAAGVALLVMVALMHQLVSTGAAYSRPQVRPLSLSLSLPPSLLVMVALMHQLVSTGAAYSHPQVMPLFFSFASPHLIHCGTCARTWSHASVACSSLNPAGQPTPKSPREITFPAAGYARFDPGGRNCVRCVSLTLDRNALVCTRAHG